jgi:N-methylhydantoinase A/oxoprolinase/acetone carboxylase beta subunit
VTAADDASGSEARPEREEQVFFEGEWRPTGIYDRDALNAGDSISGPAIVIQQDATTVIEPGYGAKVDGYGNLIIRGLEGSR